MSTRISSEYYHKRVLRYGLEAQASSRVMQMHQGKGISANIARERYLLADALRKVAEPQISAATYLEPSSPQALIHLAGNVPIKITATDEWETARCLARKDAKSSVARSRMTEPWNAAYRRDVAQGKKLEEPLREHVILSVRSAIISAAQGAGMPNIEHVATEMTRAALALISLHLSGGERKVAQAKWTLWTSGYPVLCDVNGTVHAYGKRPFDAQGTIRYSSVKARQNNRKS